MQITPGKTFDLDRLQLPANALPLTMVWIEAGRFIMGSPEEEPWRVAEDEQQFEAILSHGFWLGQHLVTQAQWQAVMETNPSFFQQDGLNRPVENVSWHEAVAFCEALNERYSNELPMAYRFGLPTEVQWEYACRAGTQTMYYGGETEADLARMAWYAGNSDGRTHPVGEKEPNAWGLYDMQGNVGEWCLDSPSDYPEELTINWVGSGDDITRVIRGGTWGTPYDEGGCFRSAFRGCGPPDTKRPWFGFRLSLHSLGGS